MARRISKYLRNNVLGLTALFIALGAGAYAAGLPKNSVKAKQIKAGAVKNAELADDAVTSQKVEDGSLLGADFAAGQLPAGPQGPAGSPDTAQQVLDKLKQVDGSGSGLDADTLAGATAASLKDTCPAGMTKIANTLCIDSNSRGANTWGSALTTCATANLRMPSISEALLTVSKGIPPAGSDVWTGSGRGIGTGTLTSLAVSIDTDTQSIQEFATTNTLLTFCATSPSDG
jgi:hypothetical protein